MTYHSAKDKGSSDRPGVEPLIGDRDGWLVVDSWDSLSVVDQSTGQRFEPHDLLGLWVLSSNIHCFRPVVVLHMHTSQLWRR